MKYFVPSLCGMFSVEGRSLMKRAQTEHSANSKASMSVVRFQPMFKLKHCRAHPPLWRRARINFRPQPVLGCKWQAMRELTPVDWCQQSTWLIDNQHVQIRKCTFLFMYLFVDYVLCLRMCVCVISVQTSTPYIWWKYGGGIAAIWCQCSQMAAILQ